MSDVNSFTKDPDATLDYGCDWSEWLDAGETITASSWVIALGLTLESADHTSTLAVAWLSGGAAGSVYRATNRVTTSAGRTDERTLLIYVEER